MITYDPSPGTHIAHACAEAERLATLHKEPLKFKFNDIELIAEPGCDPDKLVIQFQDNADSLRKEYEESDAGKAEKNRRTRQIAELKSKSLELLDKLDSVLASNNQDELMTWLKEFTPAADDIAVTFDKKALAAKFEKAGFKENEGVGQKPEYFAISRNRMAGYIVGQVINCLNSGMPPHPITIHFVERYFAMK